MDQAFAARHQVHASHQNTGVNWWYQYISLLLADTISLIRYISPSRRDVIVNLELAEGPFTLTIVVTKGYPHPVFRP